MQAPIRRAYSAHFLRCVRHGAAPLSLQHFARLAARIQSFGA